MKLQRTFSLLIASWIVLSSGFTSVACAETLDPTTIADPSTQTQTEPLQQPLDPLATTTNQETTLTNNIDSSSTSGGATVANNTAVESASSGDATVVATVINIDSQSSGSLDKQIESYSLTPSPNGSGDITLSLDTTTSGSTVQPITIPIGTNTDTETVNNLITLSSGSGSITADSNTSIGQLSSGDAYANANVINILGSNVSAPEIFLGYITVDGNLTGDILLPDALLSSILNNNGNYGLDSYTPLNSSLSYALTNGINTKAISGSALADANSSIGDIGSGVAANLLNTNDLVGLNVYGQTGLLVFINVTGTWDGNILGQNKGVTSALLGVNGSSEPILIPLSSEQKALLNLNNLINITSQSGDISATKNSSVGNIKTGDAITVVNIANIVGSNLIFTKNFGILFITILGDWYGSFGVDTPYGGQKTSSDGAPQQNNQSSPDQQQTSRTFFRVRTTLEQEAPDSSSLDTLQDTQYSDDYNSYENSGFGERQNMSSNIAWVIPFIGSTIALGLLQTNKKTRIRLSKK